jgi:DNA mismatch repair protein MutS2
MEDLLATLERKEKEASSLVESLSSERMRADRLREELREREKELEAREKTAESRAKEEARRLLLDARQEVEAAIQEVRSVGEGRTTGEEGLEAVSRSARRRVEEAARRHRSQEAGVRGGGIPADLGLGDRVRLAAGGAEGVVVELRDDRAVVETAGVRLQVPLNELVYQGPPREQPAPKTSASERAASSWQGPEGEVESEIDLRGLRVLDVDVEVDRALDQAVLAGLGELRIIHGKGTGALRERVKELLGQDGRVLDFRMGIPAEGGGGVTVVRLR